MIVDNNCTINILTLVLCLCIISFYSMNTFELSNHQNQISSFSDNQLLNQESLLICSETKTAFHVCLNSNCAQNVFLCDQRSCQCFKKHKGCIKSSIQSITEALQQKIISIQPFENRINQLINQAIDDLSLFADQIIDKARQTLDYVGLTENERKFIKIVKNGEKHAITSKQIHQIYESIDNNEQFTNDMNLVEQKINKTWNSLETEMKKSFTTIKKLLNLLTEGGASHFFGGSKIIKKYEERVNLTKFFDKKIKQTSLLYRASQNNFEVQKFYENCNMIENTLIVCKTEYNKLIGGFTGKPWEKLEGQEKFFEDYSRSSFVFSLTNNDRFRLLPNCYATKYSSGGGPTFGNTAGFDLSICDKANTVKNSLSNLNCAYHNERYSNGNANSWQKFSGSKDVNFLLKEWQAWHVEFEN